MNILIVSHQGVASGIASAAQMIVGDISQIHTIELTEAGVDVFADELENYLKEWLSKDTGIVLADLKGGTPFNTASRFSFKNENVAVMYGMNLPLVITASLEASEEGQTLKKLTESLTAQLTDTIGLSELYMNQK